MKVSELIQILESKADPSYACEWDNAGLQVGRKEMDVHKVLVALDATDEVIDFARENGCDFILTHHPLLFSPVKKVTEDSLSGRRILTLAENKIACYSMHTNFDAAPGCMADLASDLLGLADREPLDEMGEDEDGIFYGIGKYGVLEEPVTLEEFCDRVKRAFGLERLTVYPGMDMDQQVISAAVCPGAGASEIEAAMKDMIQVLVTGDITHHKGLDASQQGLTVIDAGHYGLEHIFIHYMAEYVRHESELEVMEYPLSFPCLFL